MINQKLSVVSGFYRFSILFAGCAIALSLTGCDLAKNQLKPDRSANLEMQDFRDGLAQRTPELAEGEDSFSTSAASIPGLQPYVAPAISSSKPVPLVSISVNQSVPLRDVLFELAEQAEYDIELDPGIRGSIIFTARERPFDEVVQRIAEIAGLRYKFADDVLRVELDTPYNKTYKIDYLSYIRTNKGSVRNNVAVVTGEGADTGSSFEAAGSSESDFWGELEVNLEQILDANGTALKTRRDPRITATEQNPDVAPLATTETGAVGPGGQPIVAVTATAPQAVLNVESLPIDEEEEGQQNNNSGQDEGSGFRFSLNKQSGLVTVYASDKAHTEVAKYLELLRRASTAQVLIEAKILEVNLSDEFATGIDWRALDLLSGEVALNYLSEGFGILDDIAAGNGSGVAPLPTGTTLADNSNFVLGYSGNDVQAVIQAISGFGTVRALASPRMTVLNNQSAVLNVATNHVYFEIDIDVTVDEGVQQTDISSDIHNVPEGVLVNVQPSINLENGTISLALRPTVTRIVGQVPDPAVQFVTASAGITGVESNIPELNVQEIDSVIQVQSGQPVILGGLLQDRSETSEEGVPVLSEVPMLGSLFRQHNDLQQKTELVIFMKATILESPGASVDNTDRDIYRTFSGDRRPLKL